MLTGTAMTTSSFCYSSRIAVPARACWLELPARVRPDSQGRCLAERGPDADVGAHAQAHGPLGRLIVVVLDDERPPAQAELGLGTGVDDGGRRTGVRGDHVHTDLPPAGREAETGALVLAPAVQAGVETPAQRVAGNRQAVRREVQVGPVAQGDDKAQTGVEAAQRELLAESPGPAQGERQGDAAVLAIRPIGAVPTVRPVLARNRRGGRTDLVAGLDVLPDVLGGLQVEVGVQSRAGVLRLGKGDHLAGLLQGVESALLEFPGQQSAGNPRTFQVPELPRSEGCQLLSRLRRFRRFVRHGDGQHQQDKCHPASPSMASGESDKPLFTQRGSFGGLVSNTSPPGVPRCVIAPVLLRPDVKRTQWRRMCTRHRAEGKPLRERIRFNHYRKIDSFSRCCMMSA